MSTLKLKIFCYLSMMGLVVGVSARLSINPEVEYVIQDSQNNALTLPEERVGTHVITASVNEKDPGQQWMLKISGDFKNTSTLYVIRPAYEADSLTLDSDRSTDHWYSSLFNWRNSRRWKLKEMGDNQVEFINSRDGFCLQSNGLGKNVSLDACDRGLPTVWTLTPVTNNASVLLPDSGVPPPTNVPSKGAALKE